MTGLATGVHYILVRKIGYRPVQLRAILVADDTLEATVELNAAAVELAPIEVTVSAIPPGMDAYEERRKAGAGYFIGSRTLRQSEHRLLADIFRTVRGVSLQYGRGNKTILVNNRDRCPMQIYMDGIKIYESRSGAGRAVEPPDINLFSVAQLEAIEVYRGPAETPPQLSGTGGSCGTVVLWSRRR
jgi:outer membrane receptor for ferrienterochelin and colicin